MPTQVADPKTQNTLAVEPSERKTSDRVTMPWEYDERRLEKEQSGAVAEAERILFSSTGSMLNEFKPLLENVTNIAGGIVSETPGAFIDLGKQIAGVVEKQPEIQPEDQKEVQVAQWQQYRVSKLEETDKKVSQESMQQLMKAALLVPGGIDQNAAAELGLNSSFARENIMTRALVLALATKRSQNLKAADKVEQAQDETEVQGSKPVANMNEVMEGGLIGGAQAHIGPVNAGG